MRLKRFTLLARSPHRMPENTSSGAASEQFILNSRVLIAALPTLAAIFAWARNREFFHRLFGSSQRIADGAQLQNPDNASSQTQTRSRGEKPLHRQAQFLVRISFPIKRRSGSNAGRWFALKFKKNRAYLLPAGSHEFRELDLRAAPAAAAKWSRHTLVTIR